jgi:hypothetical protein
MHAETVHKKGRGGSAPFSFTLQVKKCLVLKMYFPFLFRLSVIFKFISRTLRNCLSCIEQWGNISHRVTIYVTPFLRFLKENDLWNALVSYILSPQSWNKRSAGRGLVPVPIMPTPTSTVAILCCQTPPPHPHARVSCWCAPTSAKIKSHKKVTNQ